MTVTIKQVAIDDVISNIVGLFEEHRDELTTNKELMKLNPDMGKYYKLEEDGVLLTLAAYDGQTLIGYSVNFIGAHLHYKDVVVCNNDLLFLTKNYRQSRIGLQLIGKTEEAAKERGAHLVLWHAKENTTLAKMMPRLGYGVQDIIFSKELK